MNIYMMKTQPSKSLVEARKNSRETQRMVNLRIYKFDKTFKRGFNSGCFGDIELTNVIFAYSEWSRGGDKIHIPPQKVEMALLRALYQDDEILDDDMNPDDFLCGVVSGREYFLSMREKLAGYHELLRANEEALSASS